MSAQSIALLALTFKATGALTTNRFVTPAIAQAAAGANTLGVVRQTAAIGDAVTVDILGTAQVEAGAAVAAGATIGVDASGRGITWASGAKVAVALEAASAAGQVIECLLIPNAA